MGIVTAIISGIGALASVAGGVTKTVMDSKKTKAETDAINAQSNALSEERNSQSEQEKAQKKLYDSQWNGSGNMSAYGMGSSSTSQQSMMGSGPMARSSSIGPMDILRRRGGM